MEKVQPDAVKAVFDALNVNRDGLLDPQVLKEVMRQLGGPCGEELDMLLREADSGSEPLRYSQFVDWLFAGKVAQPSAQVAAPPMDALSTPLATEYMRRHDMATIFYQMASGLEVSKPEDPLLWMMRFLADRHRGNSALDVPRHCPPKADTLAEVSSPHGRSRQSGEKQAFQSERLPSEQACASVDIPIIAAKSRRLNVSACLRRSCMPLLQKLAEDSAWRLVEDATDVRSDIYFVWDGKSLLSRLSHPSHPVKVPQLPRTAWVSRMPGMAGICDKVNMAVALRLLQQLWPERFRFWPRSWLLPTQTDQLRSWLSSHPGQTVIVKPEGGSQGEGIFLTTSSADLDVKLSTKPQWGYGFGALAQVYLPAPYLLDGLKFDLRLYAVVTSTDPLRGFLCREGLARFCTAQYEAPTPANSNKVYMHLTNYSVNKKSTSFVKDDDPFDVNTTASKRPLSTLMAQIAAQEALHGRTFHEAKLYSAFEEIVVVFLQAVAPVLNATYKRVVSESIVKPKAKAKAKPRQRKASRFRRQLECSSSDEECTSDEAEAGFQPKCFQVLGVDVLIDEQLQPWLLEVNARPSMLIENPVRMADAPPGMRRCACRDMDGEEHVHLPSEIDLRIKRTMLSGAFDLALHGGPVPGFAPLDLDKHSPAEVEETLQAIGRIYTVAGGEKRNAFTTSGVRRALAGVISSGFPAHRIDSVVSKWKHEGFRQEGIAEEDDTDIGLLDFAALLQEVAVARAGREEDPLDALVSLIELCDPA